MYQKFLPLAPGEWFSGHENDFTSNFPLVDVSNYISKNRVQILTKNPKNHIYVVYSKKLFLKLIFRGKTSYKLFSNLLSPRGYFYMPQGPICDD